MSQTSFPLSGVSNTKALVGDNKIALSVDTPEQGGNGFFTQLTQWFSGDLGDAADAKIATTAPLASRDVLFEQLTAFDPEESLMLMGEGEMLDPDSELPVDNNKLHSLGSKQITTQSLTSNNQLTRQDGEALLQRLDESAQALQQSDHPSNIELGTELDKILQHQGKVLPLDLNAKASADKINPISLQKNTDTLLAQRKPILVSDQNLMDAQQIPSAIGKINTAGSSLIQQETQGSALEELARSGEMIMPALGAAIQKTDLAIETKASKLLPKVTVAASIASTIAPTALTKSEQDALMRAHLASQSTLLLDTDAAGGEMIKPTVMGQHPLLMNQSASAVNTAINPQTLSVALALIPWTPLASQEKLSSLASHKGERLETVFAHQSLEQKALSAEGRVDQFAQQLATSFGNQSATTASRLENSGLQSPLQLTQQDSANALSERVNIMLSKNLKHVDIRLDPPELGRMQIKLSMNNDQASVQFTVNNHAAREMIEQSLPRLREMMQQQGLQLGQSSVQHQDAGGRHEFAGNQTQSDNKQTGQHDSSGRRLREIEQDIDLPAINHEFNVNFSKDRVDYYA